MKYTLLAILLSFSSLHSQNITEKIITYKKKYSNLFSTKGAKLQMDLVKEYKLDEEENYTYSFVISIESYEVENVSMTFGGQYLGILGISNSISGEYVTNDYGGIAILSNEMLESLYSCANSVFIYTNSRELSTENIPASIISCDEFGIKLSGEYNSKIDPARYYFSAGNASFQMSKEDFIKIVQTIQKSIKHIENN
ncbi:hypothetical protein [Membranihabitans marinus]|uniref:hypothetical protein n=1 Tax=Membranihabitans marinus TaxID=1227546 RepID=UPI001F41EAC9|nr:hypothetical protein [Membranihabitans marinus]